MPSEVALISILVEFCRYLTRFFVSSGHSCPLHEWHCLTCMWLGCLAKFCLRDSPCLLRLGVRTACLAHHRIYLFYIFPQQLGIGRIAHGTLQKILVPLPWRLFFVSPKTSRSKLFGGFFVISGKDNANRVQNHQACLSVMPRCRLSYAKIQKNHNTGNQIVRFLFD